MWLQSTAGIIFILYSFFLNFVDRYYTIAFKNREILLFLLICEHNATSCQEIIQLEKNVYVMKTPYSRFSNFSQFKSFA